MKMTVSSVWLLQVLLLLTCIHTSNSNALLGVDLGSEWIRVSLVKPGTPMEIVINKESNRRTPLAVLLLDDERLIGEPAMMRGLKKPQRLSRYLTRILGCSGSSPLVRTYQQQFPYVELREDNIDIVFGSGYSPEEMIGMILNYTRAMSEEFADFYPSKDVVLTVPPYFTQAQRRALLRAAELGEVNVLQLINSNAAIALHFGVFQTVLYADRPIKVLFFDMGATSTIATVVGYELINTVPKITVMGTGFNRQLGGSNIDAILLSKIASDFEKEQASKGYTLSVAASPKATVKLLSESSRVKKVLSANSEHYAQIESFLNDIDLKVLVQRSEMEELCNETFSKIPDVITEALEAAGGLTPIEIDYVVPVGGSTRVPKVREILLNTMKKSELTQTINAEESHATGASYQAAALSKTFKVKPVKLNDCNLFPIEISYHKQVSVEVPTDHASPDNTDPDNTTAEITSPEIIKTMKIIRKRLFHRSNTLPQKKLMTFKNYTNDLILNASYILSEKWMTDFERDVLSQGSYSSSKNSSVFNLARIEVNGVKEAIEANTDSDFKSIRVHFSMDENNLFNITGADAVFERKHSISEKEKGTLEGISDTIRGFFSSESVDSIEDVTNSTKKFNHSELSNGTAQSNKSNQSELQNGTTSHTKSPPLFNTFYYDLPVSVVLFDYDDPNKETRWASKQRLKSLTLRDEEKKLLERAMNNLESELYSAKDRLHQFEAMKVTSDVQQREILNFISSTSEWFFDQDAETPKEAYIEKLSDLNVLTKDVFMRIRESKELPLAMYKLMESLNASKLFLDNMQLYPNLTAKVFTDSDYALLSSKYNETVEWLEAAYDEQASLEPHQNPTLTVSLLQTKQASLEHEVRYLMGKLTNLHKKAQRDEILRKNESKYNKTAKGKQSLDLDDLPTANKHTLNTSTEPFNLNSTLSMTDQYDNSSIYITSGIDTDDTIASIDTDDTSASIDTVDTSPSIDTVDTSPIIDTADTSASIDTVDTSASIDTADTSASIDTADTSASIDTADTSASIDTDDTSASIDTDDTSASIDTDDTSPSIDTVDTSPSIDTDDTSASIDTDDTSASIDTDDTSASIDTVDTSPSIDTADTSAGIDTPINGDGFFTDAVPNISPTGDNGHKNSNSNNNKGQRSDL